MMTSASTFSDKTTPDEPVEASVGETADPISQLPQRPFPALDATYLQHGKGHVKQEVLIIAMPNALQEIHQHGISNLRSELGGFLLGRAYQDNGRLWLTIETALPAASDDHGPVHFTFGADSWSECHKRREALFPDLMIIGWYHTHPGLGVFYSSDDVVVHTAGFSLPWHVGLVVDPVRNEASFFGWVNDSLANMSGYFEHAESTTADSIITWRYAHTNIWNLENYDLPYTSNQLAPHTSMPPALISPKEWGMLAAIAGVLLFFFLGGWIAFLERDVTQLERVILTQIEANPSPNTVNCSDPSLRILVPETETAVSVGSPIQLIGTADYPDAGRYELSKRPANSAEAWERVSVRRFDQTLGNIGRWSTRNETAGLYDLRLTALRRANGQLIEIASCQIQIELR